MLAKKAQKFLELYCPTESKALVCTVCKLGTQDLQPAPLIGTKAEQNINYTDR